MYTTRYVCTTDVASSAVLGLLAEEGHTGEGPHLEDGVGKKNVFNLWQQVQQVQLLQRRGTAFKGTNSCKNISKSDKEHEQLNINSRKTSRTPTACHATAAIMTKNSSS